MISKITFHQLISFYKSVRIPMIQRDYAQGRVSEAEVRDAFLNSFAKALKPGGEPLNLDFIYGYLEPDERGTQAFCPFDGQQRLTTLFLLHWCLACQGGEHLDFLGWIANNGKSRFTYHVRPSSRAFFDALVHHCPAKWPAPDKNKDGQLSKHIKEQCWFAKSWEFDPTVKSTLGMLNALNLRLNPPGIPGDWASYQQLKTTNLITFQVLNLGQYPLADDLYVKMNARGKPLTPFEKFKADLVMRVRELNGKAASDDFNQRMDTRWTDLFWSVKADDCFAVDDQFMRVIRTVAMISLPSESDWKRALEALKAPALSYERYDKLQCINPEFVTSLATLLNQWSAHPGVLTTYLPQECPFSESETFKRISYQDSPIPYAERVQLAAYQAFFRAHGTINEAHGESFGNWMRIMYNLAENQPYDEKSFRHAIASVNETVCHALDILSYVANGGRLTGFDELQNLEEQLKAQLIIERPAWRTLLLEAERHRYFNGQIGFLLEFCGLFGAWLPSRTIAWTESMDAEFQKSFKTYGQKARLCFDDKGVIGSDGKYLWERALLAIGDYLLDNGTALLENGRSADWTWRRLLQVKDAHAVQRTLVRLLLDRIDLHQGREASLQAIIDQFLNETTSVKEWRQLMVRCPDAIGYCSNRRISHRGPVTYLLSGWDLKSRWTELWSYVQARHFLPEASKANQLQPFDHIGYHYAKGEYSCAYLTWLMSEDCSIGLNVAGKSAGCEVSLFRRQGGAVPELLGEELQFLGYAIDKHRRWNKTFPKEKFESELAALVKVARGFGFS